jgi:lipoprotein-releasing system ATP-binding protein
VAIVMKEIRKTFGTPPTEVLRGISGEINTGEMISISGRSGSGKSTLLYIISSLDKPSSGEVLIDGRTLASMNSKEIHQFRNQKMGFVFQFHHLLPELTAIENILMPTLKSTSNKASRAYGYELLEEFSLSDKSDRLPSELSGGEQQRVAIARSLVMKPKYLFADEPTGNLDSRNGEIVLGLFSRINRERGTTVIYVTHDPLFAKLASRQIFLVDGMLSPVQ